MIVESCDRALNINNCNRSLYPKALNCCSSPLFADVELYAVQLLVLFLCCGIQLSDVAITLGSGHGIGCNNLMCNTDHRICAIMHYDRVQYKIIR